MNTFARKVAKFRRDNQLSLRDFAGKAGISCPTVMKVERGGMPSLETFANLIKVMKLEPAQALKDVMREVGP